MTVTIKVEEGNGEISTFARHKYDRNVREDHGVVRNASEELSLRTLRDTLKALEAVYPYT